MLAQQAKRLPSRSEKAWSRQLSLAVGLPGHGVEFGHVLEQAARAQQIVHLMRSRGLLQNMPELDAMAEKANRKG